MDTTLFQYCQKIIVFNDTGDSVLLAKRKGETDFDETFSFIGGKLETTDGGFIAGLKREKDEEIGERAKLDIFPDVSVNEYYTKKNGQAMVLPHTYAIYRDGDILLSDEYSEYAWVKLTDLADFEPKIKNITPMVDKILKLKRIADPSQFVRI